MVRFLFFKLVLALSFLLIGCSDNSLNGEFSESQVLQIETASDGSGSTVPSSIALFMNESITLYPIERNINGDVPENIEVQWTLVGSSIDLLIEAGGKTAQVQPLAEGTSQITISSRGRSITYSVTISQLSDLPDDFSFTDLSDVAPNATHSSDIVQITGLGRTSDVSVNSGEYRICTDGSSDSNCGSSLVQDWTSSSLSSIIESGHFLQLRQTTTSAFTTDHAMSVTVGSGSATWTIRTMADVFVSTWQTTTPNESITLPLNTGGYSYNFTVDWGDGSSSTVTSDVDPNRIHTYTSAGIYTVTITGLVESWQFNGGGDKDKILTVENFGDMGWVQLRGAFQGCSNLTTFRGGNLSSVINLTRMFQDATNVTPDTSDWDVSSVTQMQSLFYAATAANPDVSNWNTSNVTDMEGVFRDATSATPDVSNWNTSSVTKMTNMFSGATIANPDVSNWDVSSVTLMSSMFSNTSLANPDVRNWNVSSVTTMATMFQNALAADPDTSLWTTTSLQSLQNTFRGAVSADPDVSGWDTSNVLRMDYMFHGATSASPDMSGWNVANVTDFTNMFNGVTLPTADYSNFLIKLEAQNSTAAVSFDGGNSEYNIAGGVARAALISDHGWSITDAGPE